MFGFPMPDMGNMVKQIEDFKAQFERLVSAVEKVQQDQARIMKALKIEDETPRIGSDE